jgi:hypothetical protein
MCWISTGGAPMRIGFSIRFVGVLSVTAVSAPFAEATWTVCAAAGTAPARVAMRNSRVDNMDWFSGWGLP